MFSFNTCHFVLLVAASWNAATSAQSINLGLAGDYAILANTGISTVPLSAITGDIGVSSVAATLTGFGALPKGSDEFGEFSTSHQVAAPYKCYGQDYTGDHQVSLATAFSDMEAAYDEAAGLSAGTSLTNNEIGGSTLTPGVYTIANIGINSPVTFDAQGDPNAVFVMQTGGTLTQAGYTEVILAGQAKASNIFWQVAGVVTVGPGAHIEGVILGKVNAVFQAGSTMNGRVFAQTAVTLISTTITEPSN
jgi:hypothetical protein